MIGNMKGVLESLSIPVEIAKFQSICEKSISLKLQDKYPKLTFIENDRSLIKNPETERFMEIDILVKKDDDIICAIEYNGIYWHDKQNQEREELKTRLCAEKGFKLFHIWEDSEEEDFENVVSFLNNI